MVGVAGAGWNLGSQVQRRDDSSAVTDGDKTRQISPSVGAVEPTSLVVASFCAERFVEPVRRARRFAEEEHRADTLTNKSACHATQQEPANALLVEAAKRVDLVQFAGKPGDAAVVSRALGKTDQVPAVIFDDETEPASVGT